MFFKAAVNSLFWAFMLGLFYLALSLLSNVKINAETFSLRGALVLYFSAFASVLAVSVQNNK